MSSQGKAIDLKGSVQRLWGLDLLRCLAIIAVVLSHYPKAKDQLILRAFGHYGWAGVDLFFVLSGYLIGNQFFKEYISSGKFRMFRFYMRRFFRTLPNYYIVLAVFLYFMPVYFSGPVVENPWPFVFFLQNFGVPEIFSASWSLCIEEHFYLFFPIVALWVVKTFKSLKSVSLFVVGVLILQIVIRSLLWLYYEPAKLFAQNPDIGIETHLANIYYPTYTRLDGLTVGVFMAYMKNFDRAAWQRWIAPSSRNLMWGCLLILVGLGISYYRVYFLSTAFGYTLLALGCGLLTMSSLGPNSVLERFKFPGVHFIAVLSYAIYLTHVIAMDFGRVVNRHFGFSDHGWMNALFNVFFIVLLGSVLYYGFEKPFLKLRDKFYR